MGNEIRQRNSGRKKVRAFLKKSPTRAAAAKNFFDAGPWALSAPTPMAPRKKVFCFFFSKKKRLLSLPSMHRVMPAHVLAGVFTQAGADWDGQGGDGADQEEGYGEICDLGGGVVVEGGAGFEGGGADDDAEG